MEASRGNFNFRYRFGTKFVIDSLLKMGGLFEVMESINVTVRRTVVIFRKTSYLPHDLDGICDAREGGTASLHSIVHASYLL